jgi:RNA polymerase sigma factor (sigma-70 family)
MTHDTTAELRERARRALESALGPDAPPPSEMLDAQQLARLEVALRSLPRRRRAIFLAARHDGLPYAEIAQRTGLSRKRVEREFARALLALHRVAHERRPGPWWPRFWRP